ncbi:MAG: TIR domain-containing protein [Clostridia bacterium]|nr:TIR domain-containing protein [Clostridia bacterium]
MANKRYDFFISYNKRDAKIAARIAAIIKGSGLTCWWQGENSRQEYAVEIQNGIDNSEAFVVLLSAGSAESEWVGKEILRALRLHSLGGYSILPIVVDDLSDGDYAYFHQILGNFNWLFLKDYDTDRELIFAMTGQVNIRLRERGANSIYSAEAEEEIERLRKQNNLYNMYAKRVLDELFSQFSSPVVMDLGCSDGESIMLRLEGREFSHLLCIDKEQSKVNAAKEKFGKDERIDFMVADVTRRGFGTGLKNYLKENGLEGFDIIHISAVLLHLKNPVAVLKALRGALKPGGKIFIQDEDDGYNLAYQEEELSPCFFSDCFYIWYHSKESGDRHMGRKLPAFLKAAGYSNIEMKSSVLSSVDFDGEFKEDLWDLYFNPEYWVVDSPDYFDKSDAFEKCRTYAAEHREHKEKYMRGEIFVTLGVLIFTAEK